jgi:hypothetical protein
MMMTMVMMMMMKKKKIEKQAMIQQPELPAVLVDTHVTGNNRCIVDRIVGFLV